MSMEPRLLFPDIPPELRNLIYANTISPSQATNIGLPFESKTFTLCHTRVVIEPIHHGNPSILALQNYRFQEASEYHSYLLTHAIQLRITVLFNGHMNSFIQEHWDGKMASHLKNLLKKFPWLAKVSDYHFRILWEPVSWVAGKKRRNFGAITKRMVDALTGMMDGDLKKKRGFVRAELQIGRGVASDYVSQQQPLGLADFLETGTLQEHVFEVRIAAKGFRSPKGGNLKGPFQRHDKRWDFDAKGCLVFRKEVECGKGVIVVRRESGAKSADEAGVAPAVFLALAEEFTER